VSHSCNLLHGVWIGFFTQIYLRVVFGSVRFGFTNIMDSCFNYMGYYCPYENSWYLFYMYLVENKKINTHVYYFYIDREFSMYILHGA